MYSKARDHAAASLPSAASADLGTAPSTPATMDGLVPQVTWGARSSTRIETRRSKAASGSEGRVRQYARAASRSAPAGARGLPARYSYVDSSGAIIPARAPASMVMLQTVIRSSMLISRTASPAYSMTQPVPPPIPIRPMRARTTSFAWTPAGRRPASSTSMVPGRRWRRAWVARTCSTSEAPIPNARAPKAPCVDVWESPQTRVVPGRANPCSGPATCEIPLRGSVRSKKFPIR